MMMQNTNAAHQWNERSWTTDQRKMTIDLPAERVLQDSTLIEQMIAMAFDRLEHFVVELRVCESVAMASELV
jgi:hypothetical protein